MSFWYLQFSQKTNKKIRLYYYGISSRIVFVRFLGELKTQKRHFEINWPLCISKFSLIPNIRIQVPWNYQVTLYWRAFYPKVPNKVCVRTAVAVGLDLACGRFEKSKERFFSRRTVLNSDTMGRNNLQSIIWLTDYGHQIRAFLRFPNNFAHKTEKVVRYRACVRNCGCSPFYKRGLWASKSAGAHSTKSLKISGCKRWCPKDLRVRASAAPVLTHSLR